jgi:hypothetical protein
MNVPMHRPGPIRTGYGSFARGALLPPATLPVAFVLLLLGLAGTNLPAALFSVLVLVAGCMLLWRPGEPPTLLFAFAYPWLQGSVSIFHANWLGIDVAEYTPYGGDMHAAVIMSLGGLLALALGMRLGAGPRSAADVYDLRDMAASQPLKRWLRLYGLAWIMSFAAASFAWVMPGLTQPLLALAGLRWAVYFMLAVACFSRGRGLSGPFVAVFLFELGAGVGGYFADFRTVLVVTLFAAVASGARVSARALLGIGVLAVLGVALAVVWTAIKGDYRTFASGGEAAQIVTVDYQMRVAKLYELAANLDSQALANGVDQLLRRLTYVEFFGVVLAYVPANLPHTAGAIFWDAIIRPFLPRILFVDKDVIDDTARTNLYTGGLAGSSEGVSISLGYIAESYIDFGPYGMFAALLGVGLLYGLIYRLLVRWRRSGALLGMAAATAVLVTVAPMENSFTKVFGGVIVSLVLAVAMIAFVIPRSAPWLVRR